MMTLRRMQQVVATLDDDWHSPLADELVQLWANDGSRPVYVRASANFVFFFRSDPGRHRVFRFVHEPERDRDTIEAELAAMEALAAAGGPVAHPIRSRNGNLVETAATGQGAFHVAAFERVFGEQCDLEQGLSDSRWRQWGRALGTVHNGPFGSTDVARPSWEDHVRFAEDALADDQPLLNALGDITRDLDALPRTASNFGLIHFDFELDNIVWRDNEPVAIDFDDCARYWYAADVAFALRDLFDDNAANLRLDNPHLQLFVFGYREVRDLPDKELVRLPLFLRFHHCVGLARLRRSLTPPMAGEPDWVPDLRSRLEKSADELRAILLA